MEAELNEATKINSNTENVAVAKEANVDEVVTVEAKAIDDMYIDLKEERKKQVYKQTIKIDI